MKAAVQSVNSGETSLRAAARLYNVPVETLRRRTTGLVEIECRPGPPTIFSKEEEDQLAKYLTDMADMGFGLSREDVMALAFNIAEKTGKTHPFKGGFAGRGWYEGFKSRHPRLTLRSPQPLSYCRALCSNKETIDDFFEKLGGVYGRLNLISKPMQIFNVDETGIGIVHKPGKVIAEVGRRNVHSLTSAEKGKTHTIISCVSASGMALPPMMIYPRKRCVPEKLKEGAVRGTIFKTSESGWVNQEIYLEWFDNFLQSIPPKRPVLLIQDGHSSHLSIELIELAQKNDVHLLCLPAHTTHILQPLDVGVFKSFKSFFSKACHKYMMQCPGRVVTNDVLASLVGEAWPQSFTPLNVLGGFKKCGIYPLNPGQISDRQTAPSKALAQEQATPARNDREPSAVESVFTPEEEEKYKQRYEEGYDLNDPAYTAWLKINHPASVSSNCRSSMTSSSASIEDILVLPKPSEKSSKRKRKPALTHKAVCITDEDILAQIKEKEAEKKAAEEAKARRKMEREQKQEQRKIELEKKKIESEKRKEQLKRKKEKKSKGRSKSKGRKRKDQTDGSSSEQEELVNDFDNLSLSSSTEEECVCPICGLLFEVSDIGWICCDQCGEWLDFNCAKVTSDTVPDVFFCPSCTK